MSQSEDARRRDPRIEKVNLVQLSRFDEEGFRADLVTGRTLNISTGGLRIELHHAVPLRSKVKTSVVLDNDIVDVEGTVVYLESLDETRVSMGIAFDELEPETQAKIADYVRSLETE